MPEHPTLKNPPIVEALIDIQVEQPSTLAPERLTDVFDALQPEYAQSRKLVQHAVHMTGGEAPVSSSSSVHQGIILLSADNHWVGQARRNGVTLSRVNGYANWSELRSKARALWAAYEKIAPPTKISRIALRYVNRLTISVPCTLEEHFALRPLIPNQLPQNVVGIHSRVVLPFEKNRFASVSLFDEPNGNSSEGSFILDIDVSTVVSLDSSAPAWDILDELREIKNKVFFSTLTPSTIERYA